jgi:hypothetical protein
VREVDDCLGFAHEVRHCREQKKTKEPSTSNAATMTWMRMTSAIFLVRYRGLSLKALNGSDGGSAMRLKTVSWVLVGLVGLLPAAGCGGKGSGAAASTPGAVKVDGALGEQRTWTVDQLATLPLQTQDVTFLTEAGASKNLQAKGVALLDLLQRAKPRFDAKTKRDAIRYAVLVHAVDDYKAVISWAEIDPDLGAKPVLVDVEENGKKLDRPNIVVPGDKEGGRHVDAVDRISLVEVKAS